MAFCIPAIWALCVPGYYGASDDVHIAWLQQLDRAINAGQFPPRYVPDLSYGFGYPLFNFVFPLPFYIAEVFHKLGASFVDSIKLVFLISVPVSGIGMFLLLKKLTDNFIGLLGAVIYIYTPYRSVDLYVRGAIGEIVSFAVLPFILLSVLELTDFDKKWNQKLKYLSLGSISLGALVLSHNIATYMFLPFMILLGIFRFVYNFWQKKEIKKVMTQLLFLLLMGILSLALSLYFWLPALYESSLMKYDTVFNFVDHFPEIKQLLTPYWGYGASVPGPYDGISFFLGYINVFLLFAGLPFCFVYRKKVGQEKMVFLIWVYLSLAVVFFMMNFRSAFLWSNLPLLPYFQFPWRYEIITTLLIPLILVVFYGFFKKWIFLILCLVTVASVGSFFRPQDFLGRKDDYYIDRYIPVPVVGKGYLLQQEEYLRLPSSSKKRPDKVYDRFYSERGGITKVNELNSLDANAYVSLKETQFINYSKYNFPGWEAKIDGNYTKILTGEPFGQISIVVPPGNHKIEVGFKEADYKKVLDAVSLLTLTGLVFMWILPVTLKKIKLSKKANE